MYPNTGDESQFSSARFLAAAVWACDACAHDEDSSALHVVAVRDHRNNAGSVEEAEGASKNDARLQSSKIHDMFLIALTVQRSLEMVCRYSESSAQLKSHSQHHLE